MTSSPSPFDAMQRNNTTRRASPPCHLISTRCKTTRKVHPPSFPFNAAQQGEAPSPRHLLSMRRNTTRRDNPNFYLPAALLSGFLEGRLAYQRNKTFPSPNLQGNLAGDFRNHHILWNDVPKTTRQGVLSFYFIFTRACLHL
jgi:hypothetical protein